jgi:hypothetical protein
MKLTKKQKCRATEMLLDMLDGAYRCPPTRGLKTQQMLDLLDSAFDGREVDFTLEPEQLRELLHASGKAVFVDRPYGGIWRLSPEELIARFTYKAS